MSRRAHRTIWPVLAGLLVLGALFLSVFPTRTWLDQRGAISDSRAELAELDAELGALDERVGALDSPEEIERLAREDYGMVKPGEEAYGILPLPAAPIEIPPGWPFTAAPPADAP
ncbi:MAG: septum formation initiator family protein [Acidimicrobiia bacterium]|nr:septum formation initiator family protein [Acidimicrobiia bacterium]